MIRQADVLSGSVVHLAKAKGYLGLYANEYQPAGWLESTIFKSVTQKAANYSWRSLMAKNIAICAFPVLALLCISLVTLGQFSAAAAIGVVAIWSADIRSYVLAAEYQQFRLDLPKILAWAMLGLSIAAALYLDQEVPFDALLFAGLVVGLQWHILKIFGKPFASPILLALLILIGATLGVLSLGVKFLVALQLISLLASSNSKNATGLKAN
jgi:hypothetical protein